MLSMPDFRTDIYFEQLESYGLFGQLKTSTRVETTEACTLLPPVNLRDENVETFDRCLERTVISSCE